MPEKNRATRDELEDRVSYAAMLKLQHTTPGAIMAKLVETYGVSIRQARRYLALASEEVRTEGLDTPVDPFNETAHMALRRLQLQMLEATPSELPRLIAALAKLREVMAPGPSLHDSEILQRAAFAGGLAKSEPFNT